MESCYSHRWRKRYSVSLFILHLLHPLTTHPITFKVLRDENFLRREAENSYNYILNTIYLEIVLLLLVYFHGCFFLKMATFHLWVLSQSVTFNSSLKALFIKPNIGWGVIDAKMNETQSGKLRTSQGNQIGQHTFQICWEAGPKTSGKTVSHGCRMGHGRGRETCGYRVDPNL